MHFVNSAEKLSHVPKFFSSRAKSDCKNIHFFLNFFPKKFPWTRKMQFWQRYRKHLQKQPIFFDKFQRMIKKEIFQKNPQKFSYRHFDCSSGNPGERTFWLVADTLSLNVTDHSINFVFFEKKTNISISSNEFFGRVKCNF